MDERARKERAETRAEEEKKRTADEEGRRLEAVRAAEKAGFWYTENSRFFEEEEEQKLLDVALGFRSASIVVWLASSRALLGLWFSNLHGFQMFSFCKLYLTLERGFICESHLMTIYNLYYVATKFFLT